MDKYDIEQLCGFGRIGKPLLQLPDLDNLGFFETFFRLEEFV
jgi:hypothetical protein